MKLNYLRKAEQPLQDVGIDKAPWTGPQELTDEITCDLQAKEAIQRVNTWPKNERAASVKRVITKIYKEL